jgi:hypothetical protein
MRQRGKQSAASLEASPSESTRPTLRPPPHLSASEARLFNEVVLVHRADNSARAMFIC